MTEYASFDEFLKTKLEEGVEIPSVKAVRAAAFRRRRFAFAASAAALAAAGVFVAARPHGSASHDCDALAAIEFLEEACGGANDDSACADLAERLLAWQDAPYETLLPDPAEL